MSAPGHNGMRTTYQDSYANPLTTLQQQQAPQQHAALPPLPPHQQPPNVMAPPRTLQQPAPAQPSQLQRQPSAQLSRTMSYEETYRMGSFLTPSPSISELAPYPSVPEPAAHQHYPPHHTSHGAPVHTSAFQQYAPQRPPAASSTASDPFAPSAPPLHQRLPSHGATAASPASLSIPSFSIPQHVPSTTANDAAIAHALARELGTSPSISIQRQQQQKQDAAHDHALALQTHDEEVERLCAQERGAATPSPEPPSPTGFLDNAWDGLTGHISNLVPVIPRVNSVGPWGVDTRSKDRDRLQCRLDFYALAERQVKGDGNCQFRALSDQLYGSEGHHARVRHLAVQQLAARPDKYALYVPTDYQSYVSSMAQDGTWGDHVTLQAIADTLGVHMNVVSSFLENAVISIHPSDVAPKGSQEPDPDRTLWLSFWAEVHYNSIYPKANSNGKKVLGSRTLGKVVRALSPGMH